MSSIWGCGTRFYGESDPNPREGSFITTEWISFMYIPIIPLVSYRIWVKSEDSSFTLLPPGFEQKMEYEKVQVEFQWRQVFKTYRWTVLAGVLIALAVIFY